MKPSRGFTLVEVLIVLAIIGILVAISVPKLLTARVAANESAALDDLRTALTGRGADGTPIVCPTPATTVTKSGYDRGCTNGAFWAVPSTPGRTGVRGFAIDASARICFTMNGTIPNMSGLCNVLR